MKRITEKKRVADMVVDSPYRSLLEELDIPLFLRRMKLGNLYPRRGGSRRYFKLFVKGNSPSIMSVMMAAGILWHRGARHTASEKWRCLNRMTQPFLHKRRRLCCAWLSQ